MGEEWFGTAEFFALPGNDAREAAALRREKFAAQLAMADDFVDLLGRL